MPESTFGFLTRASGAPRDRIESAWRAFLAVHRAIGSLLPTHRRAGLTMTKPNMAPRDTDPRSRARRWVGGLLFAFLSLATVSHGQDVDQLLSKAIAELQNQRYDDAWELFDQAWEASEEKSSGAALGLAQIHAHRSEVGKAARLARVAADLADNDKTRSAALLLAGASGYQHLREKEALEPIPDDREAQRAHRVLLVTAVAMLEQGLELAGDAANSARVVLAEVFLQLRLPAEARAVLDQYFAASEDRSMDDEAKNLRCLAGGPAAEFEPPPPRAEIERPVKLSAPHPRYTEAARKKGWEGKAVVQAVIDEKGDVACSRVVQGAPYGLAENALAAVLDWKYKPATHHGKPIPAMLYLSLNFRLRSKD